MKTEIRIFGGCFVIVMSAFAAATALAAYESMTEAGAQAEAVIAGTDGSTLNGVAHFVETNDGLQVDAEVFDVPNPGQHGFHIHEFGLCDDQGKAAGGHYNPLGVEHGFFPQDGEHHAHAGDMGSIDIDEQGRGTLSIFLPGISLANGQYNVADRSVILHEKADDFSQPTGNAGGRIGCGVITVTKSL